MRFKKRYILCEIVYGDGQLVERCLNVHDILNCVKDAVQQAHGDYGTGALQKFLHVKHFNRSTNFVIIRVDRTFHKLLLSAIVFIKKIGRYDASFQTLHVSGTLRSCHKFLVRYHRQQLPLLLNLCSSEEEKMKVKSIICGIEDPVGVKTFSK